MSFDTAASRAQPVTRRRAQSSDADLLRAAAAGDGDAFAALFRRHEAAVKRFAMRRCASADDVADLVADTFLAALRGAARFRGDADHALPWLLGIALHVAQRQHRSAARRLRLRRRAATGLPRYAGEEAEAIIAAVDAARQAPALEAALASLSRRDREVLELVAYDGLAPAEAAIALGISANAARVRLSRARRAVQASLDEPGGSP
jgi:RNA polymerase sigma-70 factor (ECF subfamily)